MLAIGEAEQWGPIEALSALMTLPTIKHGYFPQSVLQAWLTRTVPAIAVLVALILLAGWLLNRLIRRLPPAELLGHSRFGIVRGTV